MPKKITSHALAKLLLEQPDMVVMVNADFNASEAEELTEETLALGSLKNSDHAGGVTDADQWIKLGR
jgi:hypothetical protein